jgi:hypothetical protein
MNYCGNHPFVLFVSVLCVSCLLFIVLCYLFLYVAFSVCWDLAVDNAVMKYSYYYYNCYYYAVVVVFVSCHRPFLPGTPLEPTVIPNAHASSFTLQYFSYYM